MGLLGLLCRAYTFAVDISSNPQLVVSFPSVNASGIELRFLLSGGIPGQQYTLTISASSGATLRVDKLTISVPSSGDCGCETINPVPALLSELSLGGSGYANTAIRLFWGSVPPANPNALDQWYDTTNLTTYEWITDGVTYFWSLIASPFTVPVPEAPNDGQLYGRKNSTWVPIDISSIPSTVTISLTPPVSPIVGSLWFDSSSAQVYVYYDDGNSRQWVPIVNQVGAGGGGGGPANPPPTNTSPPTISGTIATGQDVTCLPGTWTGSPTYAYQWMRNSVNIPGEIASTHIVATADQGYSVSCNVTATNAGGSASLASNALSIPYYFPAGAAAIYSTRLAVSGYLGKALQVRKSSGATQDIGFVGNDFDAAAAIAFAAGSALTVSKWYDQSGHTLDLVQATVGSQPSLLMVNNRAYITFEGHLLSAASSVVANSDHTVGIVGWSGTGAAQQIPMGDFGGTNGWFLVANNSVLKSAGYYSSGGSFQNAATGGMMAQSPMRWMAARASGALTVYLNGASVKTAAGATNTATGSKLVVGGFGTTPSWQGSVCEAFVYTSSLTPTVVGQIDASQVGYFTGLDLATPYAGGVASVQCGANDLLSFGNILQKDQGAAGTWTAFGVAQFVGQIVNFGVLFTNANLSPTFTAYELFVDPQGQLRVRLINNFTTNLYLGVIGACPSLIDGKKHMLAASYDGTKPATMASIKMYVDGVRLTNSLEQNGLASLTIVAAGQNFIVGNQQPNGPNITGPVSFFQLDNVVRNDAYIANYYPGSATPRPPADGLNTDMRLLFSEGSGTTVTDSSHNAFVGTLSSSGLWVP